MGWVEISHRVTVTVCVAWSLLLFSRDCTLLQSRYLISGGLHMRTKSASGVEMLHSVTVPSWLYIVYFIFREFYMLTTSATWWGQLWTSMSPCLNQWPSPVYSPCVASLSSSRYLVIFYALLLFYSTFYLTILKYIHVLCFIWSSFFVD